MNEEQIQQLQKFVEYLLDLTPNEMALLGSAIAILLSQPLNPAQQNVCVNLEFASAI